MHITITYRFLTQKIRLTLLAMLWLNLSITADPPVPQKHKKTDCNPRLWNYVWKPHRLHLIEECVSVSGIIMEKKKEDDGDIHIRLLPDKDYLSLLNDGNRKKQEGCLVVEIICTELPKDESVRSVCEGYYNQVMVPKKGAHVKVTGALVLDKHNGWIEIHPVSGIEAF